MNDTEISDVSVEDKATVVIEREDIPNSFL